MSEVIVTFFRYLLQILWFALLARVILSWIAALAPGNPLANPTNPIVQVVLQITEPILAPLRRVVPTMGMIDFTPLVAFLLIILLQQVLEAAV